jgi:hypothetical protein
MSGFTGDLGPTILIPTVTVSSNLTSAFAGLPPATLQQFLTNAQTALDALLCGRRETSVSYGEGSGQKAVTFTRTTEAQLRRHIRELKELLGQAPRRAAGYAVI